VANRTKSALPQAAVVHKGRRSNEKVLLPVESGVFDARRGVAKVSFSVLEAVISG
jgi:hypothetical protein